MGEAYTAHGIGLGYHDLRLDRTTEGLVSVGAALRSEVAATLEGLAEAVEQIGSSAVVGLLAKPIIDLAVGLPTATDLNAERERLEVRPWFRVAHIHAVERGGSQWRNYQRFRDLLRQSPRARDRYEAVKVQLIGEVGNDRTAYTDGKSDVVRSLLDAIGHES